MCSALYDFERWLRAMREMKCLDKHLDLILMLKNDWVGHGRLYSYSLRAGWSANRVTGSESFRTRPDRA